MKDPMLDEEFLKELDHYHHHHTWAKIISLNFDEYPLEEIQGIITTGSINVDGSSALRRTCSLSMVAENVNLHDFYWGLHTKFYLYIGLENFINPEYPDIIWFKQGMFVITSFNCSVNTNNFTISLQGKDKMTFLNGDLGGVIPASWDFATEDVNATDANGNTIYDSSGYAIVENHQIPIKQIILEAVHEFAQEPWQNIIVNDLDDYGIELLEYEGDTPLYYILEAPGSGAMSREVAQITPYDMTCWVREDSWQENTRVAGNNWKQTKISLLGKTSDDEDAPVSGLLGYESLLDRLSPNGDPVENENYMPAYVKLKEDATQFYTIAKISKKLGTQVCGYRICDIIYPYDLILGPGDTVTSMLDKLVKMLGNFEYFYDVDGRFVFQKKRTYIDVSYNNIINEHTISDEVWADSKEFSSKYSYSFENNELLSNIQNAPNISNLKNDFSLWGARQNGNVTVPIHMRYAIDHKPLYYKVIGHQLKRDAYGNAYHYLGELNNENIGEINFYPGNIYYINENGDGYNINNKDEKLKGWIVCEKQSDNNLIFRSVNNFNEQEKECLEKYNYIFIDKDWSYISERGEVLYPKLKDENSKVVDWREIIYQMANDYRRHYHDVDFLEKIRNNNMYNDHESLYPKGRTGYEQYYIDFEINLSQGVVAYWRELYNLEAAGKQGRYLSWGKFQTFEEDFPDTEESYWKEGTIYNKNDRVILVETVKKKDENGNEIGTGKEVITYWKSVKDNNKGKPSSSSKNWLQITGGDFQYDSNGWNVKILNNPEILNFWFDFIDTTGDLNKYGVNNIGLRSKATNDDKIKAIYFREVPNVIFRTPDEDINKQWVKPGYSHINVPEDFMSYFHISSRGKNMLDVIEEYMYSYIYPISSVTLTSIPIYYLTPNTLIYINDSTTGTVGEYIMNKFSLQLGLSATMSITAMETAKRVY